MENRSIDRITTEEAVDVKNAALLTGIRELISRGVDGQLLPSRNEMARMFDVPESLLSQALNLLYKEGSVFFVGIHLTYINKPNPPSEAVMNFTPTGYSQQGIEGFDRRYSSQTYDRAEIEIFTGEIDPVEIAGLSVGTYQVKSLIEGSLLQEFFEMKQPLRMD